MNIEKELNKRQKRSATYKERHERFKRKQERINQRKERIKPIKDWWYSLFREARFKRHVRKINNLIIPSTKRTYLSSLIESSTPNIHFPVFINRSVAFDTEDYTDGFRLQRYLVSGFSYKASRRVGKSIFKMYQLGYTTDESFLTAVKADLDKRYGKDYQTTPIQYEYTTEFSKPKATPYFILSIRGPHPRKKL